MDNPSPQVRQQRPRLSLEEAERAPLAVKLFEAIRDIRDPEHPNSLEELSVVDPGGIYVEEEKEGEEEFGTVVVEVTPTVPHCSMAAIIGLSLRARLQPPGTFGKGCPSVLPSSYKLDLRIAEGTHVNADELTKQLNDKERVTAALENPLLRDRVMDCIVERADNLDFEL
mmetsp:Transcript_13053/g.32232  ORF Transcript_13053/g.32232 Transcript_13053/m.32232 type:complete len:170 (-) Transcript_13053:63-572(-)